MCAASELVRSAAPEVARLGCLAEARFVVDVPADQVDSFLRLIADAALGRAIYTVE